MLSLLTNRLVFFSHDGGPDFIILFIFYNAWYILRMRIKDECKEKLLLIIW